jgi:hypothetical protein
MARERKGNAKRIKKSQDNDGQYLPLPQLFFFCKKEARVVT